MFFESLFFGRAALQQLQKLMTPSESKRCRYVLPERDVALVRMSALERFSISSHFHKQQGPLESAAPAVTKKRSGFGLKLERLPAFL